MNFFQAMLAQLVVFIPKCGFFRITEKIKWLSVEYNTLEYRISDFDLILNEVHCPLW